MKTKAPPPYPFTPAGIYSFIRDLWPQLDGFELTDLEMPDRQALGANLFAAAPVFVFLVGQAMIGNPELFSAAPFDGAKLLEKQKRADALRTLHELFLILAHYMNNAWLVEQAGAVKDARSVLPAPHPFAASSDADADRLLTLGPALRLLLSQRKKPGRRDKGKAKARPKKKSAARELRERRQVLSALLRGLSAVGVGGDTVENKEIQGKNR